MSHNDMITEHSGHKIYFSEFEDSWRCPTLGLSDKSLKTLKKKINTALLEMRRANIPVLVASRYSASIEVTGTVTSFEPGGTEVWVAVASSKNQDGQKFRRKYPVEHIIPDTPENRATISEISKELKRLRELVGEQEKKMRDIPRIKVPEIVSVE